MVSISTFAIIFESKTPLALTKCKHVNLMLKVN